MNRFNRLFALLNLLLLLCFAGVACSHSSLMSPVNPGPTPAAAARPFTSSAIPNNHTFSFAHPQARGFDFSLIPTVHAQGTPTASMAGDYSGFCGQPFAGPLTSAPASTGIFGLGFNSTRDADECDFNNSWAPTAQAVLDAATDAPPIIGAGLLGPLVVIAKKVVLADSTDGAVTVWLNHGGTWTKTPLACDLGSATATGNTVRCEDSVDTVSVADGDNFAVILTETGGNADGVNGLQVFVGKQ